MTHSTDVRPLPCVSSYVHSEMTLLHRGVSTMRAEKRFLFGVLGHYVFAQVNLLAINAATERTAEGQYFLRVGDIIRWRTIDKRLRGKLDG